MNKTRVNLTILLKHIDTNNFEIYEAFRHDEADRKELDRILGYVLPVWVSGCANGSDQVRTTIQFNQHVNRDWQELANHPELRAKVLAAIGPGHQIRHDYHMREQKGKQGALTELLMRQYPDIRKDEVRLWCSTNSEADLTELCQTYGVQVKDREAIFNNYHKLL